MLALLKDKFLIPIFIILVIFMGAGCGYCLGRGLGNAWELGGGELNLLVEERGG